MMFKTGLLVLASPLPRLSTAIPGVIKQASAHVRNTLYVHLAPGLQQAGPSGVVHVPLTQGVKQMVHRIYIAGAGLSDAPDIRVILSNIHQSQHPPADHVTSLHNPCEVVLSEINCDVISEYVSRNFPTSVPNKCINLTHSHDATHVTESESEDSSEPLRGYDYVVLGGTFDRLHTGHKILLSEACLLADKGVTIGVTDGPMCQRKTLCELICPVEQRIQELTEYLTDCKPSLRYNIVPILDPFGPSIVEPELQCIVVSQETIKGGHMVNEKRKEKGLSTLDLRVIELVEDSHHAPEEEEKVSSSSQRKRLLGTLIREPVNRLDGTGGPYIIGLTGGIASGKSSICRRLEKLGAAVIDCDKLGHKAYEKGSKTLEEVVQAFGEDVLSEEGEINRKVLGAKVFSDKSQLEKLNQIVWPAIARLAKEQMKQYAEQGHQVVILDAAVLLEAGWDHMVHEVWVSIVPRQEAVSRIVERNKLSEEQATQRIDSQLTNQERVNKANVVLSTLWVPEVTQVQVEKAWNLLLERIKEMQSSSQ